MARNTKNTAASVHQRLLNKARESSRPFNELLQHFAIERFIYRFAVPGPHPAHGGDRHTFIHSKGNHEAGCQRRNGGQPER